MLYVNEYRYVFIQVEYISFLRVYKRRSDSYIGRDDFFVVFSLGKVLKCSNYKRSAFILKNAHMNALFLYALFEFNSGSYV